MLDIDFRFRHFVNYQNMEQYQENHQEIMVVNIRNC